MNREKRHPRTPLTAMSRIADIRHHHLLALIDEAGSTAKLARLTGVPASYLSQVKNRIPTPAGRPRGIGDDIARQLEAGMKKPAGWMDQSELSPAERDLIRDFRSLSAGGQRYAASFVSRLLQLERPEGT